MENKQFFLDSKWGWAQMLTPAPNTENHNLSEQKPRGKKLHRNSARVGKPEL